ncbi:unnamed protein product [marine sediment metagenome]|uniref:Uncharacterized protein n=1 Tax=marine sediment metagenome TaxID=412755 RepID=X1H911_9ZZZZ
MDVLCDDENAVCKTYEAKSIELSLRNGIGSFTMNGDWLIFDERYWLLRNGKMRC